MEGISIDENKIALRHWVIHLRMTVYKVRGKHLSLATLQL